MCVCVRTSGLEVVGRRRGPFGRRVDDACREVGCALRQDHLLWGLLCLNFWGYRACDVLVLCLTGRDMSWFCCFTGRVMSGLGPAPPDKLQAGGCARGPFCLVFGLVLSGLGAFFI